MLCNGDITVIHLSEYIIDMQSVYMLLKYLCQQNLLCSISQLVLSILIQLLKYIFWKEAFMVLPTTINHLEKRLSVLSLSICWFYSGNNNSLYRAAVQFLSWQHKNRMMRQERQIAFMIISYKGRPVGIKKINTKEKQELVVKKHKDGILGTCNYF